MEIKTGKEIVSWTRGKSINELSVKPYNKKWVAVDDLIKYLEGFPSYHYSSLTVNRECAENNITKIIEALS